jgi:hypothetical protein
LYVGITTSSCILLIFEFLILASSFAPLGQRNCLTHHGDFGSIVTSFVTAPGAVVR